MLRSRMRVPDGWCPVSEIGEFVDVAVLERLMCPGIEFGRPRRWRRIQPEVPQEWQARRQEPASDDEYALVAKRSEAPTDFKELFRIEARHRHLQHRHIG